MYRAGSLSAFALIVLASLGIAYSQPSPEDTSSPGAAQNAADDVGRLHTAMLSRIAVSMNKRTGRTIPAFHCRHAVGGCEERLGQFARYLISAGDAHGIDPWLLAAMAFKESGFNPFAMGSLGELGILQINPGRRDARQVRFIRDQWYRNRCRKEPGACQQEIVNHAAHVLARSVELCKGNLEAALGAYNSGRCNGNKRYTKRVLTEVDELRRAAGLDGEAGQLSASRS
jgi:soluble lytic murein transglycosylase-like protein